MTERDDNMSMFEVVGEGSYDPSTDNLTMRKVEGEGVMSCDDICDMVNYHLTYKEGWEISAQPDYWTNDMVQVYCEFRPENSSPRNIDPRDWVIASGVFNIKPGTKERVQQDILAGIMSIEAHEVCEFVRFDGKAPFHPHRKDGRDAYRDASKHHRLPAMNDG